MQFYILIPWVKLINFNYLSFTVKICTAGITRKKITIQYSTQVQRQNNILPTKKYFRTKSIWPISKLFMALILLSTVEVSHNLIQKAL